MELLSAVHVIKLGEESRLISDSVQNIVKGQRIRTIQSVQTASVAALKRVKVLTKTSIRQFGIIEKQHLRSILVDFTALGIVLNIAKRLNRI
jgi:hypothetical protein